MKFMAYGHKNILSKHRNTIEFTKDKEVSLRGDCILGVNADYDLLLVKKLKGKLKVKIKVDEDEDEFFCYVNEDFNDDHEMVFRISEFNSERTLGLRTTKAAKDIKRSIVEKMKQCKEMEVEILEETTE